MACLRNHHSQRDRRREQCNSQKVVDCTIMIPINIGGLACDASAYMEVCGRNKEMRRARERESKRERERVCECTCLCEWVLLTMCT